MQDPSLYSQIRSLVQPQPQFPDQEHLKCPRCDSANTKFCYYNNYNLSQPRHFCKNCKRYWTKGGALRNIPVGGGSRKNTKRTSSSAASGSASSHNHQNKRPAASASASASASDNSKTHDGSEIKELLPLEGDNYVGQFATSMEVTGGFSSMLGPSGRQFGTFLDGTNGSSFQFKDHFGDPGPGHNMDHQVGMESGNGSKNGNGGFMVNGGSGLWLA